MAEQHTFRLRKGVLVEGLLGAPFFLLATIFYGSLFFPNNPAAQGFCNAQAAAALGGVGVTLFAAMFLLSLGAIRAYYVEQFRVEGNTIGIRSVLQNRQFTTSEIESVKWKLFPNGGGVRFRIFGRTARVDLHGFSREDRLKIIRIVRDLVAPEQQQGWDMFCHKVALPLRDGTQAADRMNASFETILMTRQRADRLFAVLIPVCSAGAIGLWRLIPLQQAILLPVATIGFWLFHRFSIPKEGKQYAKVMSVPGGRAYVALMVFMVLCTLLPVGWALIGIPRGNAAPLFFWFVLLGVAAFVFASAKAGRLLIVADRQAAEVAAKEWQQGEQVPASASVESNSSQ